MEKFLKNPYKEISLKDIQSLVECSNAKASRMLAHIRIVLNKPKPRVITVQDFYNYYYR